MIEISYEFNLVDAIGEPIAIEPGDYRVTDTKVHVRQVGLTNPTLVVSLDLTVTEA